MNDVRRGRPVGSSPTRSQDDAFLKEASRRIVFFGRRTATEAFKELAAEQKEQSDPKEQDALVRRLQRRWKQDGEKLLDHRRLEQAAARKFQARGLQTEAPEFYAKFEKFSATPEGQKILAGYGLPGDAAAMLSLGIVKAWELIQQAAPLGATAADDAFAPTHSLWSRFGIEPDAAFLTRMGELCLAKAAELDEAATPAKDISEQETTP